MKGQFSIRWAWAVVSLGVVSISALASAGEQARQLIGPGPIQVRPETVEIAELGTATNFIVQTASSQFRFQPPTGWRMELDSVKARIHWTSADYASALTMQVMADDNGATRAALREKAKGRLAAELPAANLINEFVCYTGGPSGLAFDVEQPAPGHDVTHGRVAFIPVEGAVVEWSLLAPSRDRARRELELGHLLNSFRGEDLHRAPKTVAVDSNQSVASGLGRKNETNTR